MCTHIYTEAIFWGNSFLINLKFFFLLPRYFFEKGFSSRVEGSVRMDLEVGPVKIEQKVER